MTCRDEWRRLTMTSNRIVVDACWKVVDAEHLLAVDIAHATWVRDRRICFWSWKCMTLWITMSWLCQPYYYCGYLDEDWNCCEPLLIQRQCTMAGDEIQFDWNCNFGWVFTAKSRSVTSWRFARLPLACVCLRRTNSRPTSDFSVFHSGH